MEHQPALAWQPIQDLPENWRALANTELPSLVKVWQEQAQQLRESSSYQVFLERMRRKIAIETGIIERLYRIDYGITLLLIQEGFDVALIPHGATDKPASEVVAILQDHEQALDSLFDFVKQQRDLSTSYIKELHQLFTRHQMTTDALEKGVWKTHPNNPLRPDGEVHEYCPPIHVASEMDNLIRWHQQHVEQNIPPEIEAAWLHHRFTQIHPFQAGNGRVARCLASLVFIRAGWFPLVIVSRENVESYNKDRTEYIHALEQADHGDLKPLIDLFAKRQREGFVRALGLSEQVREETTFQAIALAAANKVKQRQTETLLQGRNTVEAYANTLYEITQTRLNQLIDTLNASLSEIAHQVYFRGGAHDQSERRTYHRYQVVETAKSLDYYANFRDYHSWYVLTIKIGDAHLEILISFHALGYEYRGLLACCMCAYWKDPSEDDTGKIIRDLQPLTESPLQFSYADSMEHLKPRFDDWLDSGLRAGLLYWQKGL
ncbi:MAG: Fic family protein [Anaerolineae bacterium]|jgi:Fic family protein|nr:Fic family protein [Anaerolineae bacterium]